MNLLIMGPPGAGKGTQAAIISGQVGLKHLSSGDLLRLAVSNGTELGIKADSYMKSGELVPDEIMIAMILDEVKQVICSSGYSGFLLDGFPRTVAQASALDKSFSESGVVINRIISLEVETEEIVNRLAARRACSACHYTCNLSQLSSPESNVCANCGSPSLGKRKDDEESVIRNRLEVYKNNTLPILDYYSENHSILSIDGSQEKDTITDFILRELNYSGSQAVEV